jgi:hypothetical protein
MHMHLELDMALGIGVYRNGGDWDIGEIGRGDWSIRADKKVKLDSC